MLCLVPGLVISHLHVSYYLMGWCLRMVDSRGYGIVVAYLSYSNRLTEEQYWKLRTERTRLEPKTSRIRLKQKSLAWISTRTCAILAWFSSVTSGRSRNYALKYVTTTLRLPHFLDNRLTDGGEVVSPTRRPLLPPGRFLVLIYVRGWIDPRAIVRLEKYN
jgi:hypothetical protein